MISEKILLDELFAINQRLDLPIDLSVVQKAIDCAKFYHSDQFRCSGEPFYTHPLEVAFMVAEYLPRTDIIVTAILHDTLEDTILDRATLAKEFGEQIAQNVYDLTRIKEDGVKITSSELVDNLWLEHKTEILMIKLFDRLHNINTVEAKSPEKIKKTVTETLKKFVLLGEILELPALSDSLSKRLYEINVQYGFVKKMELKLGADFIFPLPVIIDT